MGLRFSVQLPTDRVDALDEFATREAILEMARAIETAGFDACYVTEHPAPPDDFLATGGHHALDPFVALAVAAAGTERLRLHTNVLVLPYRSPILTAKAIASLDTVSGGRVIVGVAAGYLEGEFRALGAEFADRNARTDDALVAMKQAWSGESFQHRGADYEAGGNTQLPRPVQQPHPPIWIGGNSRLAMRRAITHGQGWCPFPLDAQHRSRARTAAIETVDDLAARIAWLLEEARTAGRRQPLDVCFVPFGRGMGSREPLAADALCEQLRSLAEVGVTWVSVGLPAPSRTGYLESLEAFGTEVIQRLA